MLKDWRTHSNDSQTVFISHGDCKEDAEFMAELIKEKFDIKDIVISPIGPVIGTHAGPNTVQYSSLVIIVNYLNSNLTFKMRRFYKFASFLKWLDLDIKY